LAIYHLSIKIITRGEGKSAVAAVAYRAGETIKNEYDGIIHDYTKKGGVVHTEIMLPYHAPAEYAYRAILWNAVEKIEKQCNSQLAREIEIALPVELTEEQNISLARRFVKEQFVSAGMCADVCLHDKGDGNPHAHIMLTMRPFNDDKTWGAKIKKVNKKPVYTTDWNDRDKAEEWRKAWAAYCNTALRLNGHAAVVDHRSYERQGVEQVPTVHMSVAASQMEKRGIRTERGDMNREIAVTNKEIRQLRARINHLVKWITDEAANPTPPTLYDVITEILNRQGQSGLTRLKNAAEVFAFLQRNNISDYVELEKTVNAMDDKVDSISAQMKQLQRRTDTLKEHIMHSENFKEYRKHRRKYDELYAVYKSAKRETGFFAERKAQKALDVANEYYNDYRPQIAMYDTAEKYLHDVLQNRFDPKKSLPPITKWREELIAKTAESATLYREYKTLRDETAKVEKIKLSVSEILHSEEPKRTPQKSRGMEL